MTNPYGNNPTWMTISADGIRWGFQVKTYSDASCNEYKNTTNVPANFPNFYTSASILITNYQL